MSLLIKLCLVKPSVFIQTELILKWWDRAGLNFKPVLAHFKPSFTNFWLDLILD